MLVEKVLGYRHGHSAYQREVEQRVVEQFRAFHRLAVTIKFRMVFFVEVLRENQFADKAREACLLGVIKKTFLDIESEPAVGSNQLLIGPCLFVPVGG